MVRVHARDIIYSRLSPVAPYKDGSQTPWGGHPVVRAQHATATCCRACLERHHKILSQQLLNPEQVEYIVEVIYRWIEREYINSFGLS